MATATTRARLRVEGPTTMRYIQPNDIEASTRTSGHRAASNQGRASSVKPIASSVLGKAITLQITTVVTTIATIESFNAKIRPCIQLCGLFLA